MAYKVGDKVTVDGEECEVVNVYGGGTGYMVETPDGTSKKVVAALVGEVEEEPEGESESEGEGENEGEGEGEKEEEEE